MPTQRISRPLALALQSLLPLLFVDTAAASEPSHHPHRAASAEAASPAPAGSERWASDAALREGMRRLRTAVAGLEAGQKAPDASADAIEAAVQFLFAECRLPPAADAALHPLLADALGAAEALRSTSTQAAARTRLQAVLQRYPQLFDDPDWGSAPERAR